MGGGTGRLPERDIKWDLAMHVYISLICPVRFIWKEFRPGKVGPRFAQPGPRLKPDNFYHINTPSRFVGMILC